jgi:hypothetical protein
MSGKKDHKNYLLLIERVDAVIRCVIALQSQIGYSGLFASKSLLLHTPTSPSLLIKDNKPMALFETKEGDSEISPSGRYFGKRLGIPLYQIAHRFGRCEAFPGNCFKIPASKFLMLTG